MGYGITYYGNGLTFADGSSVNDIVVNSSGKIVSGQYKELSGSLGWYSDKACTQKVEIGTDGLPVSGVVSDLDLYAKPKTFVLKTGSEFNDLIPKGDSTNSSSAVTDVIFTDKEKPADAELVGLMALLFTFPVKRLDKKFLQIKTVVTCFSQIKMNLNH